MQLLKTLRYITQHPLTRDNKLKAIQRFLKWQISRFFNKKTIIHPFIGDSKLFVSKGMTGATGNIYTGLHEFEDMGFLLHYLRKQDLFIDIGANIGTYTVLASKVKRANTISIEPILSTYENLENNILLNNIKNKVLSYNIGVGSKDTILQFTNSLDTINHVIIENDDAKGHLIEKVVVKPLDSLIGELSPNLIKIDVEGFEKEVLDGAINTLSKKELDAIIIELNSSGKKYGYSDDEIHLTLTKYGFTPFSYNPIDRKLTELKSFNLTCNTIYIRNKSDVMHRLKNADVIKIFNKIF